MISSNFILLAGSKFNYLRGVIIGCVEVDEVYSNFAIDIFLLTIRGDDRSRLTTALLPRFLARTTTLMRKD